MLKRAADVEINSVVMVQGERYYVIDFSRDTAMVLLQTLDGRNILQIPYKLEIEVVIEPAIQRIRGFEPVTAEGIKLTQKNFSHLGFIVPDSCMMPRRGTNRSAGYDFSAPVDLSIKPEETVKFFTNLKAYMRQGEMLIMDVRSSVGIHDKIILANILTIIDEDYYNNATNEGNIAIALRNTGNDTVRYKAGDRICQAIFVPFLEADNCNTNECRKSGLGHTGR